MKTLILFAGAMIATTSAHAQSTDARGIPVMSAPATAPAGANQAVTVPPGGMVTVNPNQSAVFTPTAATGDMPPCTKAVTDHCTQTYEGRGGKMSSHHRVMHHRMRHHR